MPTKRSVDISFDYINTAPSARQLRDFLLTHTGGYNPEIYETWVLDTCIPAINADGRRAMAWMQYGQIIGDVVLKPVGLGTVEIKNFRMADMTNLGLGGAMLKIAAQIGARELLEDKGSLPGDGSMRIQLDTPAHSQAESFFKRHGFNIVGRTALYAPDTLDTIMQKQVQLA